MEREPALPELRFRLTGEVVRISEEDERLLMTVAVKPQTLVEVVARPTPEAHLGDHVVLEVLAPVARVLVEPQSAEPTQPRAPTTKEAP